MSAIETKQVSVARSIGLARNMAWLFMASAPDSLSSIRIVAERGFRARHCA